MALRSALVDRARFVRREADAARVEGTTRRSTVRAPWMRARLTVRAAPERADQAGMVQARPQPELLIWRRDDEQNVADPRPSDRVEVDSRELGRDLWEVDGDPTPLRKKRRVIGWQLTVRRVKEDG